MRGRFYSTEQLSENIEKTPEGFLILHEVPLARTGLQIYAPEEVPPDIPAGPDGIVEIERDPDQVFRPETMASAAGKPFVNDHPMENGKRIDVTPANYRELVCGTILNPRRGTGIADDLFFGDIVVTDPETIKDVLEKKKREISLGYDANYEVLGVGHAKQTDIVINHGALVESGRCGPRCQIRDGLCTFHERRAAEGDTEGETTMAKRTLRDYLFRASKTRDAGEFEELAKEAEEHPPEMESAAAEGTPGEQHFHVHLPEREEDRGMPRRDNTRHGFTDPGEEPGEDPGVGGAPPGGGGAGGLSERLEALEDVIKELVSRVEAIEDQAGGGHGGGTLETDRRGARRDFRPRSTDDEEANASESGANQGTEEILGQLELEAPPGTGDRARKARDSEMPFFRDLYQNTIAACEIIAPGMRLPTFDRALEPAKTFDCICDMRRKALELAYQDTTVREVLDSLMSGQPFNSQKLRVHDLAVIFQAVAGHKKVLNNSRQGDVGAPGVSGGRRMMTPAEINARNREVADKGFWA